MRKLSKVRLETGSGTRKEAWLDKYFNFTTLAQSQSDCNAQLANNIELTAGWRSLNSNKMQNDLTDRFPINVSIQTVHEVLILMILRLGLAAIRHNLLAI